MARKEALFKPFMFADQELDALLADIAPSPGVLADAVAALRAGNPAEAEVVLRAAMLTRPDEVGGWHGLVLASALERRGNGEAAVAALRPLADGAAESRIRLWAWTALRRHGVTPPDAVAARADGVIVEVEGGRGVETLAVYADGTARYLLPTGAKVIWEAPDKRLEKPIAAVIAAAGARAPALPVSGRLPGEPASGLARMTLLTPAGARAVEEPLAAALNDASPHAGLFAAATALLEKILEIAKW
jgi:hypothetical protein